MYFFSYLAVVPCPVLTLLLPDLHTDFSGGRSGDQSWVFIGRTDFEGEMPILWPPDAKS